MSTDRQEHGQMAPKGSPLPKLSRAQILKAAAVGAALAALPGTAAADSGQSTSVSGGFSAPYYPSVQGSYTPESLQEIVSNLLTLKMFDAALAAFSFTNAAVLKALNITGPVLTVFQAIATHDQDQIDWLQSLMPGAQPVTATFTLDPSKVSNPTDFATFGPFTGYLYMSAEIAAVREFAELGQPRLAKEMAQMLAAEAADTYTFRTLLFASGAPGFSPPNNKAFETENLLYTRDAINLMRQLGLIGGPGVKVTYPGRDAVLAAIGSAASAIIQTRPNDASSSAAFTGLAEYGGQRTQST
jgi:hypothetical protein